MGVRSSLLGRSIAIRFACSVGGLVLCWSLILAPSRVLKSRHRVALGCVDRKRACSRDDVNQHCVCAVAMATFDYLAARLLQCMQHIEDNLITNGDQD